jgi:hypothetical protein
MFLEIFAPFYILMAVTGKDLVSRHAFVSPYWLRTVSKAV